MWFGPLPMSTDRENKSFIKIAITIKFSFFLFLFSVLVPYIKRLFFLIKKKTFFYSSLQTIYFN